MKKNSLAKNIIILITLTILLKGIGFINRIVLAYFFGTSHYTDIYYNASGFAESISAIVLAGLTVGIINIYITNKNTVENDRFISNVLLAITTFMLVVSIIIFVIAEPLAHVLAPAYNSHDLIKLKTVLRYMCITFPLQGIITVYSSILQAEKKFTPVKLTGTITSLLSIFTVIILAPRIGTHALIVSFIASVCFNAIFLIINSRGLFHFKPNHLINDQNLKRLMQLVLPLLIGTAGHELNLIIDKSIASKITVGAISALSYSCVLYLFIENVIINSIVTALLPDLTEKIIQEKDNELARNTQKIIIFTEALLIPIVILLSFTAKEFVKLIYMRGSFDTTSLLLTSSALCGYVLGLPFLAVRDIITRVFYAYGDTKMPVRINMIAVGLNIILDFILVDYLGIYGITLATSISNAFSAIILLFFVHKHNELLQEKLFLKKLFKIALVIVPMLIVGYWLKNISTGIITILLLSIFYFCIQVVWLLVMRIIHFNNIKQIFNLIRSKK